MQVNSINNGQNFGLRLSKEFMAIARREKNALIYRYGLNSFEMKRFAQTIKDIRKIKSDAIVDAYKCEYSPEVAVFVSSKTGHNNACRKFKNNDALFQNILNFLKVSK